MSACRVDGCGRPARKRQLCQSHYKRRQRGDSDWDRPIRSWTRNAMCSVAGCPNRANARGLCTAHRMRLASWGVIRPDVPLRQIGQPFVTEQGYRSVVRGGRRDLEHRFVMEATLGRSLCPDERVHHKNGDRLDNRPENLELWVVGHPAGQRVEDLVRHAMAVLRRYAPEVLA